MATIATLTGNVVAFSDPANVEGTTSSAPMGRVNVQVNGPNGVYAFITLDNVSAAVLASLATGSCTVTITQP